MYTCPAVREPGAFSVHLEWLALGFGSCSAPSLTFNQYGGKEEQRTYFRNTEARDQASDVGLGGMLRNDVGDWSQNFLGHPGGTVPTANPGTFAWSGAADLIIQLQWYPLGSSPVFCAESPRIPSGRISIFKLRRLHAFPTLVLSCLKCEHTSLCTLTMAHGMGQAHIN